MGCSLALHIWDKDAMVPIDYDLEFGSSSLGWGERFDLAKREIGALFTYYDSEHRNDSVDGVRCWISDEPELVLAFAELAKRRTWGNPDERIFKIIETWKKSPHKLRFVFELV